MISTHILLYNSVLQCRTAGNSGYREFTIRPTTLIATHFIYTLGVAAVAAVGELDNYMYMGF